VVFNWLQYQRDSLLVGRAIGAVILFHWHKTAEAIEKTFVGMNEIEGSRTCTFEVIF
jgi:hypothetical protein